MNQYLLRLVDDSEDKFVMAVDSDRVPRFAEVVHLPKDDVFSDVHGYHIVCRVSHFIEPASTVTGKRRSITEVFVKKLKDQGEEDDREDGS